MDGENETSGVETAAEPSGEAVETAPIESAASESQETPPVADLKENVHWEKILKDIPTAYHDLLKPGLKEWDQGVNAKFRDIHAQYEDVKPFKALIEQGATYDKLEQAYAIMNAMETDPRAVWDAMGEYHQFNAQTGKVETVDAETGEVTDAVDPNEFENPESAALHKEIADLKSQLQELAGTISTEREEQLRAEQAEQFEKDFSKLVESADLSKEFPDQVKEFLITQLAAGRSDEDALKAWNGVAASLKQAANSPTKNPPTVLGSGNGGVVVDTPKKEMSGAERRAMVAKGLAAASEQ
jgi:hypothetical protein